MATKRRGPGVPPGLLRRSHGRWFLLVLLGGPLFLEGVSGRLLRGLGALVLVCHGWLPSQQNHPRRTVGTRGPQARSAAEEVRASDPEREEGPCRHGPSSGVRREWLRTDAEGHRHHDGHFLLAGLDGR